MIFWLSYTLTEWEIIVEKIFDIIISKSDKELFKFAKSIIILFIPGFLYLFTSFKDKFYNLDIVRLILFSVIISCSIFLLFFIVITLIKKSPRVNNLERSYYLALYNKQLIEMRDQIDTIEKNLFDSKFLYEEAANSDIFLSDFFNEKQRMSVLLDQLKNDVKYLETEYIDKVIDDNIMAQSDISSISVAIEIVFIVILNILFEWINFGIFNSRLHFMYIFILLTLQLCNICYTSYKDYKKKEKILSTKD